MGHHCGLQPVHHHFKQDLRRLYVQIRSALALAVCVLGFCLENALCVAHCVCAHLKRVLHDYTLYSGEMGPAAVHSVVYSPHSTMTSSTQSVRRDNAIPHKRGRRAITLILSNEHVRFIGGFHYSLLFWQLSFPSSSLQEWRMGCSKGSETTHRPFRIMWIR